MKLDLVCKPYFARHETFHPRHGWVKKAVDGAATDPHLFNQDEAVVRLGIGKNMVRSLRFWGMALKVLAEVPRDTGRVPAIVPSSFGQAMFGGGGWDPYCELPGTLWLLHWSLLKPPSSAPVWWLAFNEFPAVEFTAEELEHFVSERTQDWSFTNESAIKKDVLCLLRMYASGQSKRASFEDLVDCPFRELNFDPIQHREAWGISIRRWGKANASSRCRSLCVHGFHCTITEHR